MSPSSLRRFHRVFSPWIAVILLASLATGIAYRLGRAWFGMSRETGDTLMSLHTGGWLGEKLSPFYVLLAGGGLLTLLGTGLVLLLKRSQASGARKFHRLAGMALLLPLVATALSGMLHVCGEEWFGFSKDTQKLLMTIHEGRWLGTEGRPFYVLFVGGGLLALGFAGLRLRGWPKRS